MLLQLQFRAIVIDEMQKQGINRSQLARKMGYHPNVVSKYLNGVNSPGLEVIEKFFRALGGRSKLSFESNLVEVEEVA